MIHSYEELFEIFEGFCKENFPKAVAKDYLTKLDEEVFELNERPSMEELADCMLVLVGLSRFLPGELKEAVEKKNRKK